ncbi:MAG: hypothetical protein K2Q34_05870 [Alphaproteobacteria bacterium]|nr:hypothetical protein [Alphaproteobacteria bacterium]
MIKIISQIFKKTILTLCFLYLYSSSVEASGAPADEYIKDHVISIHHGTFASIEASATPGLIIGRGDLQGIDTAKVTEPILKSVSDWFFLDPIATHHTSPQTPHSILTKWPNVELSASFSGKFHAVVFDFGVLNYLGETGEESTLGGAKFEEIMNINGVEARRAFTGPAWKYQDQMYDTFPDKAAAIEAHYSTLLEEVKRKKQVVLEEGIRSAFAAVRPTGHLFIPLEPRLRDMNKTIIAGILKISSDDIKEGSFSVGTESSDSPLLPEVKKGDGFSYETFRWLVIPKA